MVENQEDYIKEKKSISMPWANCFAIMVLILTLVVFGVPYYLIWSNGSIPTDPLILTNNVLIMTLIMVFMFLVGIVVHELIHGLTFAIFAKNGFKSIKFGVLWKIVTPYCHCKEPLKLKHYIVGALMPTILLGIIPAVLALITGSMILLIFAVLLISGGAGDLLLVLSLRNEKKDVLIEDDPSEVGYFVYRPVESSH
jgi:hypothetical protein